MIRRIAAALVFGLIAGPAVAQPKAVAQFRDWSVFVREVDGDRVCFAATEAKAKAPATVNHGDVFFLIATWKSGAATNQPSFMAGYTLKDQPAPSVAIGKQRFAMYASDNEGFIEQASDEQALVGALKRGADMRVTATSSRGTATNYVFSLNGATAALDRVSAACK